MLYITNYQKEILEIYKIDYNTSSLDELLINIDAEMTKHINEDGEPTSEFYILEKVYDEILTENERDDINQPLFSIKRA